LYILLTKASELIKPTVPNITKKEVTNNCHPREVETSLKDSTHSRSINVIEDRISVDEDAG